MKRMMRGIMPGMILSITLGRMSGMSSCMESLMVGILASINGIMRGSIQGIISGSIFGIISGMSRSVAANMAAFSGAGQLLAQAHGPAQERGYGIDELPHEIGHPLRGHYLDHGVEDGPCILHLGVGVLQLLAQGLRHHGGEVEDLEVVALGRVPHPQLKLTAGAGGYDGLRPDVPGFLQAFVGDAPRGGPRLPDKGEHAAAAQAVLAVVLHLREFQTGDGLEHVAGLLVDAAVAADVAGVVPGDLHGNLELEVQLAVVHQFRGQLR